MRRTEAGSTVAEAAVVVPILLFVVMILIQGSLVMCARAAVRSAAAQGVRDVRAVDGNAAAGREVALAKLSRSARGLVVDADAAATRDTVTGLARVVVTGRPLQLVPGLDLRQRAVAEADIERFRSSVER